MSEILLVPIIHKILNKTRPLISDPICLKCNVVIHVPIDGERGLHSAVVGEVFVMVDFTGTTLLICNCTRSYYGRPLR